MPSRKSLLGPLMMLVAVFVIGMIQPPEAQAQEFNPGCAALAVLQASQHQCSNPERRFGCVLEKAAVGFGAYLKCSGQFRASRRSYRYQVRSQRGFQAYRSRSSGCR